LQPYSANYTHTVTNSLRILVDDSVALAYEILMFFKTYCIVNTTYAVYAPVT